MSNIEKRLNNEGESMVQMGKNISDEIPHVFNVRHNFMALMEPNRLAC